MSSTQLSSLKEQLKQLRDARDGVRLGIAVTTATFWIAGSLAVWFTIDYTFSLNTMQRALMLAMGLPVLAFGLSRAATAMRGWGATLIDTALSVEQRHGIDGDLVAALQFEQGQSTGSPELQQAVIDYVAEMKDEINVFSGFDPATLRNRFIVVGLILVVALGTCFLAPHHLAVFFQRLALANISYPTKTDISQVQINGQAIVLDVSATPYTLGYGSSVELSVLCAGRVPDECRLTIRDNKGQVTEAILSPSQDREGQFIYTISRLLQPIHYQIFAGDAATPELALEILPLPAIKIDLDVSPPDYATNIQLPTTSSSTHISVLAGSLVSMEITGDRELQMPELVLRSGSNTTTPLLEPVGNDGTAWILGGGDSSLENIQETITYQVTAVDTHGLSPPSPLRGTIRVVPDRLPSVSLQTIHHIVLPAASPVIRYQANDDFGLAELTLLVEIRRGNSAPRTVEVPLETFMAVETPQTDLAGDYSLDLVPLDLQIGDQVQVVLQASDFRPNAAEAEGHSDPLHLQIGDEGSVLSAIAEADQRSEQMLSELIQQQLGLGENP